MDKRVMRVVAASALAMFAAMTCQAQQLLYVDAQRGNDLRRIERSYLHRWRGHVMLCAP